MAKSRRKAPKRVRISASTRDAIVGVSLCFIALVVFFSDASSSVGLFLRPLLESLFGADYRVLFSPVLAVLGTMLVMRRVIWNAVRFLGLLLFWTSVTSLWSFFATALPTGAFDLHRSLSAWFGTVPAVFLLLVVFAASLVLAFEISIRDVFRIAMRRVGEARDYLPTVEPRDERAGKGEEKVTRFDFRMGKDRDPEPKDMRKEAPHEARMRDLEQQIEALKGKSAPKPEKAEKSVKPFETPEDPIPAKAEVRIPVFSKKKPEMPPPEAADPVGIAGDASETPADMPDFGTWEFPPADILEASKWPAKVDMDEILKKSYEIEKALLQFRIEVEMAGQKVGPTVVQYRLKPAEGVKLSKIENLKKDLTLALKAKSIRIQAPIPGVGLVGIEVPNDHRDTVRIREVVEHPSFANNASNLALVVGKDINGDYVVGDLAKMPHLLIAGQTGSGKSVGMNGFLVSLLYRNSPSDLRLIMIDPKRVELGIYNGIPHLLTPVITEPDKALNALKWGVGEMLRRYDLLQKARVRNLGEYNRKVAKKERMPNIVIVVDELADLMMSGNKKEVETTIARIAQMARAVGMHLIVATQRPSVDVITGLIKANIPSRIAFTVASLVDSRTILDRSGAEDLLGYGDMLYAPSGSLSPDRIQGVLVTTEEVESVVNHIKRTIDPAMLESLYDDAIVAGEKSAVPSDDGGEAYDEDPAILEEAIKIVRESGKASTTMLQRRMKLGYGRAARVMDILEEMGIVGPADGSRPREVF